jgi:glutathione peroxidase
MLSTLFTIFKKDNTYYPKGTVHSFVVNDLKGNPFDFTNLKGKKIMIVNTASKCGLTPQYEKLQKIYEKYKNQNFEIIGFPANNFLWQEPGSASDIESFCSINYGVTFPMMEKISVKGKNIHPIYEFLTKKSKNGVKDTSVKWNFQKFLINENGELEKVISPKTQPDDRSITAWIEGK